MESHAAYQAKNVKRRNPPVLRASAFAMNDSKKNDNVPPNSRLFIVCGKSVEEEDFKDAFSTFGQVRKFSKMC